MPEKRIGLCPACGKLLEIPMELSAFSCLYCGVRLTPEKLLPEVPRETAALDPRCFESGVRGLVEAVTRYPNIMQKMTKASFRPFFDQFEADYHSAVEDLNRAGPPEEAAAKAAEAFLSGLAQRLASPASDRRGLSSMACRLEDAKFSLCLFLIPMIRHLDLPISEPLVQALHKSWQEAYPKQPFQPTSLEEIEAGFRQKRYFCFITTAACDALGKPDDCPELTAFRAFRDGYLRSCPDGEALIREYYAIAPTIVTALRFCESPSALPALWESHLAPCYEALLQGDNASCKARYVAMVQALKEKYLHQ